MKAIMISDHAKWCALMMNGEKSIEVRKNKALASAIQKLIAEYGYAEIYVYCTKGKSLIYTDGTDGKGDYVDCKYYESYKDDKNDIGSGKVVFKFRCYKVEEIKRSEKNMFSIFYTDSENYAKLQLKSYLDLAEIGFYLKGKTGYAIHIKGLEIFDEPKELSEFYKVGHYEDLDDYFTDEKQINGKWCIPLKKAPQNFCYVEKES